MHLTVLRTEGTRREKLSLALVSNIESKNARQVMPPLGMCIRKGKQ